MSDDTERFVPGRDALATAIKNLTPEVHPPGYSEAPAPQPIIRGGLVTAAVTHIGGPIVHPAAPPDPSVMAAHQEMLRKQAEATRAAADAEAPREAAKSDSDRIRELRSDLERLTARVRTLEATR